MSETDKAPDNSARSDRLEGQSIESNHPEPPCYGHISETQKEKAKQLFEKWISRPVSWFIKFLDVHSGAVTAAATVVIAWLTISITHDSAQQAATANSQLGVMQKQIEATIIQLRPYVGGNGTQYIAAVKQEKGKPDTFLGAIINTAWKNFGATPGKGLEAWVSAKGYQGDVEPDFSKPFNEVKDLSATDIGPGGIFASGSVSVSAQDIQNANSGHGRVFIWGEATYRDSFPNSPIHTSRFCLVNVGPLPTANGIPFSFRVYKPECNHSD